MYIYILCPIVAFTLAQGAKVILRSLKHKISWHDIFAYSDMPSGHTSVVVAIVTILGLKLGIGSPIFAVSFVFATIVIVDAIGLRNYLGQHGKTLNILVKDLKEDEFLDRTYSRQLEHIGHTPLQVIIGALIGVLTSVAGWLLF
jgi:hypothetical protein